MSIKNNPFVPLNPKKHEGPFFIHQLKAELWERTYDGSGDYKLTRLGMEVAYWASHREPIYHTGHMGITWVKNDYERPCEDHLLFFTDKEDLDDFLEFWKDAKACEGDKDLFHTLDDTKLAKFQAVNVTMMLAPLKDMSGGNPLKFWMWMRDNCVGQIWRVKRSEHDMLIFEKTEDFALYKLKFQGNNTVDEKAA